MEVFGAEREANLFQCPLLSLSGVYEGKFGVTPELKLVHSFTLDS